MGFPAASLFAKAPAIGSFFKVLLFGLWVVGWWAGVLWVLHLLEIVAHVRHEAEVEEEVLGGE